ncbi:MAG: ATP-binding protein [Nitrososphaerota archaeon]|nr:ATP-binding protein [Thermoproteota archaeon]
MARVSPVGVILSGGTTTRAMCQLYEDFEGKVNEGELYVIEYTFGGKRVLCRVDKIIPYSEFYEAGDAWSEARRKGAAIPSEISRKYVTAELELLGEIKKGKLGEVTIPPSPGDILYRITNPEEIRDMIVSSGEDTVFIEFGKMLGYEHIFAILDLNALPMHMGVLGVTGSGKSYTVGYLLEKLSEIKLPNGTKTALSVICIDANGDYLDFHRECNLRGKIGCWQKVLRFVFKKSSVLFMGERNVKPMSFDLDQAFEPREVAELVITYYTGGKLNELQVAGLEYVLRVLKDNGISMTSVFLEEDDFNRLRAELARAVKDGIIHDQTHKAILRAIDKFRRDVVQEYELITYLKSATISDNFIDEITRKGNPVLVIIDFSADGAPGVSLQLKQFVVSYITKLLLKKFTEYKIEGQERILLLIIEEAQNYCPNLEVYPIGYSLARDNLAQIATQGRKFGLSLCLVSQRPSFVDPVVLSMVNTYIIHRIPVADVSFVKRVAGGLPRAIEDKLVNLATGRAIVTGQMNRFGFPLVVDIPERIIKPTIGRINVSKILSGP